MPALPIPETGSSGIAQAILLLVYSDIPRARDLPVEVFGFEAGGVQYDGDGRAVHGEVVVGGTPIWLHGASPDHPLVAPLGRTPDHGAIVVRVADVDAHYERVRWAGAQIDSEPSEQEYGQREYAGSDPEGHRWWFAAAMQGDATGSCRLVLPNPLASALPGRCS